MNGISNYGTGGDEGMDHFRCGDAGRYIWVLPLNPALAILNSSSQA